MISKIEAALGHAGCTIDKSALINNLKNITAYELYILMFIQQPNKVYILAPGTKEQFQIAEKTAWLLNLEGGTNRPYLI